MSSGSWPLWPIHNPALVEELILRIKHEVAQREGGHHMFQIGELEFWFSDESYELKRRDPGSDWAKDLIIRGERKTLSYEGWGSEKNARFAVGLLRQRQILEDMASA